MEVILGLDNRGVFLGGLKGGSLVFRKKYGLSLTPQQRESWLLDGLKDIPTLQWKKQGQLLLSDLFRGLLLVTFLRGLLVTSIWIIKRSRLEEAGGWKLVGCVGCFPIVWGSLQRKRSENVVENGRLNKSTKAMIEVSKLGQTRHSAQGVVDNSFRSFHVWCKLTFAPWIFGG